MVVEECTGVLCLGVLLSPRDRLILVIMGTWVSFPRPSKSHENIHQHLRHLQIRRGRGSKSHHSTKLALCVFPPIPSSVRVRERGFEPSSNAVWVASPQRVPESCSPRGGGGAMDTTAGREKRHDSVWVVKVECRVWLSYEVVWELG